MLRRRADGVVQQGGETLPHPHLGRCAHGQALTSNARNRCSAAAMAASGCAVRAAATSAPVEKQVAATTQ
jgi:hypothetical protein